MSGEIEIEIKTRKRIHVGRFDYTVDETKKSLPDVLDDIRSAQLDGAVLEIDVLDDNDRQLRLNVNFALVDVFVIDAGVGQARPTEISTPPAV